MAKRRHAFLLGLALGAALVARAQPRPLRVGFETDAAPMSYLQPDGKIGGFSVDLVNAVAGEMRLETRPFVGSWPEVFERFKAGEIDLLASVAYTKERDAYMDFATTHLVMNGTAFVRRDAPPLRGLEDLATRRIAVQLNSYTHEYLKQHAWDQHLVFVRSLREAMHALDDNQCDVVACIDIIGTSIVRREGIRHAVASGLQLPGYAYELHMAVHAGDADRLALLNEGLARIRANGTYDRLHEKWIGQLKPRVLRYQDLQPVLLPLLALALAALGALFWQRRLLTRLAQQARRLRESEERLSLVLEGSEDAFWDWDMRTGHIARGERWAAMLGYTLDDIAPSHDGGRALIHPDDLASYNQWTPRFKSGEADRYDIEYRMKAKSGEWRWIHDRGKVVSRDVDGRPLRMAGTHTDITERKRTEAALIESQALLRRSAQLLEQTQAAAHIGGWEVDLRTDRLHWSDETFRLHETSPAEYTPTVESAVAFYQPESRAIITAAVEQAVREGTPYDLELDVVTAKRRRIRVRTTGQPEYEDGRVVKIYGYFRDVTAEKQAEEDRKKLHLKMLEAQKLESLGVLAGGIAHDFNNLLTVILANATYARGDLAGSAARLAHIEGAARRAADLCRQMLAYAGRGTFVVERLDLAQLVQDTAQLLLVSISKKAKLVPQLAPDLPAVRADASQLRQVVMNLVINASEALDGASGEIHLRTSRARPEVVPGAVLHSFDLPPGDCVCLEIADTGHGMGPATLARVFDPFFTTKFTGRGLGLAAVLGIMRAHNGALTVHSVPGEGTTFRLFFAAAAPMEKPHTPAPFGAPAPVKGGTLLLVDDEPVVLATADALLRHEGYKTVLASDGHEAVHQFRANPRGFTAVLLDLTMPGLDGGEVLRVMRALNPHVRILIMSGFSEHDILARVRGQGDVPLLRKPFTHETLLAKVAEVIAR